MNRIHFLVVALMMTGTAWSQTDKLTLQPKEGPFRHLDVSITTGTTGIGLDVASPINQYFSIRSGVSFMPQFDHHMHFDIQVGETKEQKYDAQGNRVERKFDRLANRLKQFTGFTVEDQIEMIGEPTFFNFKLLFDVYPFQQNKHWHFTAGFYWGPSRIAKAYNVTEAMPSLLAVGMYNTLYETAMNNALEIAEPGEPLEPYINIGGTDYYLPQLLDYGRMGIHVGNRVSDGKAYLMEPDSHGMVKAKVKVNSFRPYLGFGYGGALQKGNDRYAISFDCGMMMWGGTPKIITHDGTDLAQDVEHIGGKVERYVDLIKVFKVFPVLNVRLTRRIF